MSSTAAAVDGHLRAEGHAGDGCFAKACHVRHEWHATRCMRLPVGVAWGAVSTACQGEQPAWRGFAPHGIHIWHGVTQHGAQTGMTWHAVNMVGKVASPQPQQPTVMPTCRPLPCSCVLPKHCGQGGQHGSLSQRSAGAACSHVMSDRTPTHCTGQAASVQPHHTLKQPTALYPAHPAPPMPRQSSQIAAPTWCAMSWMLNPRYMITPCSRYWLQGAVQSKTTRHQRGT